MAANCYWDGTNWRRYNTGQAAALWYLDNVGTLYLGTVAAGSNPVVSFTTTILTQAALALLIATVVQKGANSVSVQSLLAYISISAQAGVLFGANVLWTGSGWDRIVTGGGAGVAQLDTEGKFYLYTTPAGANPATLTERLRLGPTSGNSIGVESYRDALYLAGRGSIYIGANVRFDGVAWYRLDTSVGVGMIAIDNVGGLTLYTAPAGANPVAAFTWQTLTIDSFKKLLRMGSIISSYRASDLPVAANTASTYASITLTEGIWEVQCVVAVTQGASLGIIDCYEALQIGQSGSQDVNAGRKAAWQSPSSVVTVPAGNTLLLNARTYGSVAHTVTYLGGYAGFGQASGIRALCVG